MYTKYTYQDWEQTPLGERADMLLRIVDSYKSGDDFKHALTAMQYFSGDNVEVMKKVILEKRMYEMQGDDGMARTVNLTDPLVGARIPSNFLFRFVTQQNQFLLANGVTVDGNPSRDTLGDGFDKVLESMGEKALVQGVCWAFWNVDHAEVLPAARDALSGFVTLVDEESSVPRLGVQFWQIDGDRPLYVRLFEEDGVTVYRKTDKALQVHAEKRAYKVHVNRDAAGETVTGAENYGALPIVPLYANEERRSELTESIKAKIDAYDRIMSDFVDNFDKANEVYWVLNNFGGSTRQMMEMVNLIRQMNIVASMPDGMGGNATAQPHTFEVPFEARRAALELLEKALYQDYMALSMDELTGGSLTNVAIQTAMANLELKCNRYEWQAFRFVQQLLRLLGVKTEDINFRRQTISNESEVVADIYTMREDISRKKALELNPYMLADEVEGVIMERDKDDLAPDMPDTEDEA